MDKQNVINRISTNLGGNPYEACFCILHTYVKQVSKTQRLHPVVHSRCTYPVSLDLTRLWLKMRSGLPYVQITVAQTFILPDDTKSHLLWGSSPQVVGLCSSHLFTPSRSPATSGSRLPITAPLLAPPTSCYRTIAATAAGLKRLFFPSKCP